ncbi:maternal embryonic leucine zipper kinase-like, partial [Limulus polyphemus]|uniref:Maternal embryonic leucine zipper kinase-like n=1 Tax=Limulus polyphemus TaxID=6850 RepID=A0ABM1SKL5_LIMPO
TFSYDDDMHVAHLRFPATPDRRAPPTPLSSSARKVFGSIEKGLDRMRTMLTPRKRLGSASGTVDGPRPVKALYNVSTARAVVTPDHLLESLRNALLRKGIVCKQKEVGINNIDFFPLCNPTLSLHINRDSSLEAARSTEATSRRNVVAKVTLEADLILPQVPMIILKLQVYDSFWA